MAYADGQDEISNKEDTIDSREVIARIDYLESDRSDLVDTVKDAQTEADETHAAFIAATAEEADELAAAMDVARNTLRLTTEALEEWDTDYGDELKALQGLRDQAEGYAGDWRHGCTLIRDSYFEDYAREMAEDIGGAEMREARWPFTCIDWERAASELQMDYTSVSFDGVDYWVR